MTKKNNLNIKTAIVTIICIILTLMSVNIFAAEIPNDVSSHWAKTQITDWVSKGYIKGYEDGSFKPNQSVTRAEFMTMANKAFGYQDQAVISFSDVKATDWYYSAVSSAKAAGYVSGYPDGTIRPQASITRSEAAIMLQAIKKLDSNVSAADNFSDSSAVQAWAKGAIGAVVTAGFMGGYPDGSIQADAKITRAEAVVFLDRAIKDADVVYDKAGTYGPAAGTVTIHGNVTIKVKDVILQNTVIEGNLIIDKAVGDGSVTMKNITVKGNTYISGGGVNSVYFIDCQTGKTYILRDDGPVRVVVMGNTEITEVIAQSSVKLEEIDLTGKGFEGIVVEKKTDGKMEISLEGVEVDRLEIHSDGIIVKTDKNTRINTFVANNKVTVTGKGKIENAEINASSVIFETAPDNIKTATGVDAPEVGTGVSSGGSGGSGSHSRTVAVSSISVNPETMTLAIGTIGTITATVEPTNATDKTVTWESSDPNIATVVGGLVTAKSAGTATITAKAGSKTATCIVEVGNFAKIEQDPGKTGGDVTATVSGKTITFDGKISFYGEDEDLEQGHHVGVQVTTPAEVTPGTETTLTIGETTYTGWDTFKDGDNFFYYYPLVTAPGQAFTFTVKWDGTDATSDTFTIKIADTATLEAMVSEPNDDKDHATLITVDAEAQTHWIYPNTDEDWFKFEAQAGTRYKIRTSNLYPEWEYYNQHVETYCIDTVIYLYDSNGNLLAVNDDYEFADVTYTVGEEEYYSCGSEINYTFTETGTYYVQVVDYCNSTFYTEDSAPEWVGKYDIAVTKITAEMITATPTIDTPIEAEDNVTISGTAEAGSVVVIKVSWVNPDTGEENYEVDTIADEDGIWEITVYLEIDDVISVRAIAEGKEISEAATAIVEASAVTKIANGITAIANPNQDAMTLVLPEVPDGYTIAIKSSSNIYWVTTDGTVNPQRWGCAVTLVLTVTETSTGKSADTGKIEITIPQSSAGEQVAKITKTSLGTITVGDAQTVLQKAQALISDGYIVSVKEADGTYISAAGEAIAAGTGHITFTVVKNGTSIMADTNNLNIVVAAAADQAAPVLSATSASAITDTTATLNFTSDEAGTYYYLVYAAADAAPDKAAVKAQGEAVAKGTGAASATANTVDVTGLTASTAYKAYVVVEDAANNISDVATIEITTTAAPVTVTGISVKTAPTKVTYTVGETLDLTGLVVTLTKSDASSEEVAFADFAAKDITATPANGTVLATTDTKVTLTHTASGKSVEQAITVANPAVTDMSLVLNSGLQVGNANVAANAELGTLSATGGTAAFTYELVADTETPAKSADNASFAIAADKLKVAAGGALTEAKDYKITVKVTDSKDKTFTKGFTVTVAAADPAIIDTAAIPGVTAPVRDAAPVVTITETDQYTGTVTWSPEVVDNKFAAGTVYMATITLTAKAGYTLTGVTADFFTVAGATTVTNDANSGIVTAVFPATEAALSSDAGLTSVAGQTDGSPGAQTGADADNAITWAVDVANDKANLGRDDIEVAGDATFNLYPFSDFSGELTGEIKMALTAGGNTTAYIKVTAEDGTTVKYYAVTITRAAAPTPITAIAAISGTPKVDVELTAGTLTPVNATAIYQWTICDTEGGTYTNITGAIANKYTPVAGDVGKYIKVVATGTGDYSGTVTSDAVGPVAAVTVEKEYTITIAEVVGGTATVTTDPATQAKSQATVTVSIANIEAGKRFKSITVTKDADSGIITTTEVKKGSEYTFTMPMECVTVTVEVEPIPITSATITPTTATFDKKTGAQADVNTTIAWNSATNVTAVKKGDAALTADTDYTVVANTLTIKKEYLATQAVGEVALSIEFDKGDAATLTITVSDTIPAPKYTVTFTVTDGTNPIENASITIDSQALTTNESGVAAIDLENGIYTYGVTATGFDAITDGSITVSGEAVAEAVAMTAAATPAAPVILSAVAHEGGVSEQGLGVNDTLTITFNVDTNQSGTLQDKAAVDVVIDWGEKSFGTEYSGRWIDAKALEIRAVNAAGATFVVGDSVSIKQTANIKTADGLSAASTSTIISTGDFNEYPPARIVEGSSILKEAPENDGSLRSEIDYLLITLQYGTGTFEDGISKSDVTASNLPKGLDFEVAKKSSNQLTITFTGNAENHGSANNVNNITFTISKDKVNGAENDLTTPDIGIRFVDKVSIFPKISNVTEAGFEMTFNLESLTFYNSNYEPVAIDGLLASDLELKDEGGTSATINSISTTNGGKNYTVNADLTWGKTYVFKITGNESLNEKFSFATISIVAKTTPIADQAASATEVIVGQKLSTSILTGTFKDPDTGAPVSGTLAWEAPDTVVNETKYFIWKFTPDDTTNYTVIKGSVRVTANTGD